MAEPSTTIWQFLENNWPTISVMFGSLMTIISGLVWRAWKFMTTQITALLNWVKPQVIDTVAKHNHLVDVATECLGKLSNDVEHLKKETGDSKKILLTQAEQIQQIHVMLQAEEYPPTKVK